MNRKRNKKVYLKNQKNTRSRGTLVTFIVVVTRLYLPNFIGGSLSQNYSCGSHFGQNVHNGFDANNMRFLTNSRQEFKLPTTGERRRLMSVFVKRK